MVNCLRTSYKRVEMGNIFSGFILLHEMKITGPDEDFTQPINNKM